MSRFQDDSSNKSGITPEAKLASLIKYYSQNYGLESFGLRRLFEDKWSEIRILAHDLHDDIIKEAKKKQCDAECKERIELARLKAKYED